MSSWIGSSHLQHRGRRSNHACCMRSYLSAFRQGSSVKPITPPKRSQLRCAITVHCFSLLFFSVALQGCLCLSNSLQTAPLLRIASPGLAVAFPGHSNPSQASALFCLRDSAQSISIAHLGSALPLHIFAHASRGYSQPLLCNTIHLPCPAFQGPAFPLLRCSELCRCSALLCFAVAVRCSSLPLLSCPELCRCSADLGCSQLSPSHPMLFRC